MDHRLASHFVQKKNDSSQGASNTNGSSTQAHTAKNSHIGINEEEKKILGSAEMGVPIDNTFFSHHPSKSFLPKSFDCVLVAPESQKPEEPDSVPSEKYDDGTQKASSHCTAYFSCKDAASSGNEQKSLQEPVIKSSQDRDLGSNSQ